MLAAAVGIQVHRHADVRAVVVAQDAFRGIAIDLRRHRRPLVSVIDSLGDERQPLEAAGRIAGSAAAYHHAGGLRPRRTPLTRSLAGPRRPTPLARLTRHGS